MTVSNNMQANYKQTQSIEDVVGKMAMIGGGGFLVLEGARKVIAGIANGIFHADSLAFNLFNRDWLNDQRVQVDIRTTLHHIKLSIQQTALATFEIACGLYMAYSPFRRYVERIVLSTQS